MARIVRFYQTGGPEVLRIEEVAYSPTGKARSGSPSRPSD
jgi:hypothetical protein